MGKHLSLTSDETPSIHFHRFSHPFFSALFPSILTGLFAPLLHAFTLSLYPSLSFSLSFNPSFYPVVALPAAVLSRPDARRIPELQFPRDLSPSRHWSAVTANRDVRDDRRQPRRLYTSLPGIVAETRGHRIMTFEVGNRLLTFRCMASDRFTWEKIARRMTLTAVLLILASGLSVTSWL